MDKLINCIILILSVIFTSNVYADVLELKNGSILKGEYKGGTQATIRFDVGGNIQVIAVESIVALTFTGNNVAPSSQPQPSTKATQQPKSSPHVQTGPVSLAAGTRLHVRIDEDVTTQNKNEGARFTARLESKLMAGNVEVAPVGAKIYGRVLRSERGGIGPRKAKLELTLTEIMINGEMKNIRTSTLKGEGESGGLGRKILKGAAIGALANGSDGTDTGVRVGAGIGILGGGKHAGLRNGSLIEFNLLEALVVKK